MGAILQMERKTFDCLSKCNRQDYQEQQLCAKITLTCILICTNSLITCIKALCCNTSISMKSDCHHVGG